MQLSALLNQKAVAPRHLYRRVPRESNDIAGSSPEDKYASATALFHRYANDRSIYGSDHAVNCNLIICPHRPILYIRA